MKTPYKKSILFIFFLLGLLIQVSGQNGIGILASARGKGLGNADMTFGNINDAFSNQAGLAFIERPTASAFVENRFSIKELQLAALSVVIPSTSGNFGLNLQNFGFKDFRTQKIGLNYSRKLGDHFTIGGQFDVFNIRITEYGSTTSLGFELGLQYDIFKSLKAGIHLFNPTRASIGDEKIPTILQTGLTYLPSKYIRISVSLEKDNQTDFNFRMGLEYLVLEKIYFRIGMNSNPSQVHFGLGFLLRHIDINIASSYHNILGFSSSIGLAYEF